MSSESKYRNPSLTVDAIVPIKTSEGFQICLITRGRDPFQGSLAFPGGFVDYLEDPEVAVTRELDEETHLKATQENIRLICVAGKPNRDPRRHTVSVVYAIKLEGPNALHSLQADDDAQNVGFFKLDDLLNKIHPLAFDHQEIVDKFGEWFNKQGVNETFFYTLSKEEESHLNEHYKKV